MTLSTGVGRGNGGERLPVAPLAAAVQRALLEEGRSWSGLSRDLYGNDGNVTHLKRALGLKPYSYVLGYPCYSRGVDRDLAARICEAARVDPTEAGL